MPLDDAIVRLERRYQKAVGIVFVLLFFAAMVFAGVNINAQRKELSRSMSASGSELQLLLNGKLAIVHGHVQRMRETVQRGLEHPELLDKALLSKISAYSNDAPVDAPWDALPKSLSERFGSLYMNPADTPSIKDRTEEIPAAILGLESAATAHSFNKLFAWSYYYDADKRWVLSYPALSRTELLSTTGTKDMASALKVTYNADGTVPLELIGPLRNPRREQRLTSVFTDTGGKGLLVSQLAPVYLGDTFKGVVGADIPVGLLAEVLTQHSRDRGRAFVVNNAGQVLADTDTQFGEHQTPVTLEALVADAPVEELVGRPDGELDTANATWFIFSLSDPTLKLMVRITRSEAIGYLQKTLRPMAMLGLVLGIAIFAALWAQHQSYTLPAIRLAQYLQQLEVNPETPIPPVPRYWRKWFDDIARNALSKPEPPPL